MTISRQKILGWSLGIAGVLIAAFSQRIVFPGLEHLLGIETIVGRDNVQYLPDGGYAFTNPGAGVNWIFNDFTQDSELFTQLIAPLAHANDPPPNAPGCPGTAGFMPLGNP